MYTLLYVNGKPTSSHCIAHGTLLNVMFQPGWERGLGERGTCLYMAESLHGSPETIIALLMAVLQLTMFLVLVKIK